MFIPIVPHTTVINKTIVYSDTILSLNDLGENIQVSSISDVDSYELETCLKTTFEENPNTTFNTIQYSRNDKKVYFYTNKTINTNKWHESKIKKYKPLTSIEEIVTELNSILSFEEKEPDTDTLIPISYDNTISLFEIIKLLKKKNTELDTTKDMYDDYFDRTVHEKFSSSSSIIVYGFDYDADLLRIGFKRWDDYDEIKFKKENNDFFVSESESYYSNDILALLGNTLSNLYDKLYTLKQFKTERVNRVKPINSNILVDISSYGIRVYIPSTTRYSNDFELECFSYTDDYKYDCNSHTIISIIKDKETEFLKNILIDIDDTPEWMQPILKEIKSEQLKKKEETNNIKEKPLTIGKRILNWFTK